MSSLDRIHLRLGSRTDAALLEALSRVPAGQRSQACKDLMLDGLRFRRAGKTESTNLEGAYKGAIEEAYGDLLGSY